MQAIRYALLAIALTGSPLSAKRDEPLPPIPPMPAGYDDPGSKPVNVLPAIISNLRQTLADPYSVRDLKLCEPKATKPIYNSYDKGEWMRSQWMVDFSLNAKNRMGGYAGRMAFIASYTDGKLDSVSDVGSFADANAKMVSETATCSQVPDADLQKLLAG